jgi:hypothetical protein
MAHDSNVVSIFPTDDEILESFKGLEKPRTLLVISYDSDGGLDVSANTSDKARVLFAMEVFKAGLLADQWD